VVRETAGSVAVVVWKFSLALQLCSRFWKGTSELDLAGASDFVCPLIAL
jgi:hypothetical protein